MKRVYLSLVLVAVLSFVGFAVYRSTFKARPELTATKLRKAVADSNLVICVIDAARADHIGSYGYPRQTTPNMDALAQESAVFSNHFCQFPSTRPSTASLFSSQYVDTHMIWGGRDEPEPDFTMPVGLNDSGFTTALFSSNLKASPAFGVGCAFQETCYTDELKAIAREDETYTQPEVLLRAFSAWLDQNKGERFFAYVHFLPPHYPYRPPDEMTELFADEEPPGFSPDRYHPEEYEFPIVQKRPYHEYPPLPEWINLYDANLRYADWAVGRLVEVLRDAEVLDSTLLIVTSDHGEAFGEHGYVWHSRAIHDEATRIPLLIRFPRGEGPVGTHHALTQTIDLLPTIYDLYQIPVPDNTVQGRSLLPLLTGAASSVNDCGVIRSVGPSKYMVRGAGYAMLLYDNPEWRALYDTERDPEQRENILHANQDKAEELMAAFARWADSQRLPPRRFVDAGAAEAVEEQVPEIELTPEKERELRALGYLN
ncbi:MAG: sulfatase [Proteobacteria bacterium]|nr:sulfatase [Pseudomonadota bacterium]